MTFAEWCGSELARVKGAKTFVSLVVRFNRNDDLVVVTRNDQWGSQSVPEATTQLQPAVASLAPIVRMNSVFTRFQKEQRALQEHPLDREVAYWTKKDEMYSHPINVDYEAQTIFRSWDRLREIGIDRPYEMAVDQAREEARQRIKAQLTAATEARRTAQLQVAHFTHIANRAADLDAMREWMPLHRRGAVYPEDVIETTSEPELGGHAEENFIRVWTNVKSAVGQIDGIDMFLTRMPCPQTSPPFRLGGTVYKEGCVSKLVQLVEAESSMIQWSISYVEELNLDSQPLAMTLAAQFPQNVTFERWQTHS